MELKMLGRNIRRARKSKGLTQEQVANDLKCSLNTYTKIERGETNAPFLRMVQIAEYLGVSPVDLVRDEGVPDAGMIMEDIKSIKRDLCEIKKLLSD